ncbi:MAG: FecR family protein [Bacteroidota bacterium]|nr:FecR family protein [Bacteroidota bacterium]
MPDFTKFSKEDFLAEESFTNYLLQKNANDIQFWESWIKENPKCDHEIKEARLLFFLIRDQKYASDNSKINVELDNQYSKFQSLLQENNSQNDDDIILLPKEKNISGKSIFMKMIWLAAGVAAVLLITVSVWKYFGEVNNAPSKDQFELFAKTDSSAKEITLPDGSVVQLNNYSSVEIAKDYNNKKREVLLTGSAFFKVYKNHSKPFIVSGGSIKTTALGTAFYIYNLHPQTISVSLLEGMVKVEGDKNSVQLLPGEKAVYSGEKLVKDSFSVEQLQNFTKGKIQFEHAGLREIKTILEEYFNREVVIEGNAPNINFTGNFDSKKIETILAALQFTYNIKYKSEGQKVTISFN